MPWFDNDDLLNRELRSLEQFDLRHEIQEDLKAQGILQISVQVEKANRKFGLSEDYSLTIVFPDSYPYFRPHVFSQDITLPRHQNPFDKGLCLIDRATEAWYPEWTIGKFLHDQLPKVLHHGNITDPAILAEDAFEQAEPISEYYVNSRTSVLIDTSCFRSEELNVEKATCLGSMRLGVDQGSELPPWRILVRSINKADGSTSKPSVSFDGELNHGFAGSLFALPERPPSGEASKDLAWLLDQLDYEDRKKLLIDRAELQRGVEISQVVGLTFPEESAPGIEGNSAWLFIILGSYKKKSGEKRVKEQVAFYAKAIELNSQSWQIRVPKLKGLSEKKVSIVGLGALGAPTAIELAKSGVGSLSLLDFDKIESGNIVRWPLGISQLGFPKTASLASFIKKNYPHIHVDFANHRLGNIRASPNMKEGPIEPEEQDIVNKLLDKCDLLIDASAELGISHYLSAQARKKGIPFVSIYATPGALGGLVMRVDEHTEGCWMCLQYWKDQDDFELPPIDDNGEIQPPGCGDITFTGANFDLQNVSLTGVRVAISTLLNSADNNPLERLNDVGVLRLMDQEGRPIYPKWESFKLTRHPECPYCNHA